MKSLFFAACLLSSSLVWAQEASSLAPLTQTTIEDGRSIVTDAKGLSVYTFDVDQGTESRCYDGCAKAWPPVLVDAKMEVTAPVGLTTRKDGTTQLTVDGHPVYYFIGDEKAGDINGEGLQGVWHLIVK